MLETNINFADFNSLSGLQKLDKSFLLHLSNSSPSLYEQIIYYRKIGTHQLSEHCYSNFLISCGPLLHDFIVDVFNISCESLIQKKKSIQFNILYEARRTFVQRYAIKKYTRHDVNKLNVTVITRRLQLIIGDIEQHNLANHIVTCWKLKPDDYQEELDIAAQYCAIMYYNNSELELFNVPRVVNNNLIRSHRIEQLSQSTYLGFNCRDKVSASNAEMHVRYCIYCHKQNKDSCSKGFYNINPQKHKRKEHDGCPLKQKISEMNYLQAIGYNIAALAVTVIDNPMVAATGHRICNDCMKTCIYQKQEPVNIPLIETHILETVLELPWGVEIYLLLTKWNPLNIDFPVPKDKSDYNVMVVGLGPAGFSLSHYLINEGHNVVAIDGLNISPLHFDVTQPIKFWHKINLPLSGKKPQGFGGVTEYGITHRWNKNNLILIRLILERRKEFKMYGSIRIGSNLTVQQAFEQGFDHIALCLGAGKPRYINNPDYFAKGVKNAADFLMTLQQGATYLHTSNSNMQIRLPAVIIGCGLTAIDCATELLNYYPIQVRNFANKWKHANPSRKMFSSEELSIAEEYLEHAKQFAIAENDAARLKIIQDLGGVSICYRKNIQDSPAYRLNHEEIEHAMANGVKFIDNVLPTKIDVDQYGSVSALYLSNTQKILSKTILIAIGTSANNFVDIDGTENIQCDIFKNTSHTISYFGDCNQKYSGSVVKAIASVKYGYKKISESIQQKSPKLDGTPVFDPSCHLYRIQHLSNDITEITIHSKICFNNIKPGQFFRLQNEQKDFYRTIEPIAATVIVVDYTKQLLTFIIQDVGKSTHLVSLFNKKEKITLMGPIGTPVEIVSNKNILLIGSGIGNALLIPLGKSLRTNGCNISFISHYITHEELIYKSIIEELSDNLIRFFKPQISAGNTITNILYKKKIEGSLEHIDYIYCNCPYTMINEILLHKKTLFSASNVQIICSISAPMQCMMKGICGKCIQRINNNGDGYTFLCGGQYLMIDSIDFQCLNARLSQNSLFEKISRL